MAEYYKMSKSEFVALFVRNQRRRKQMKEPGHYRFFNISMVDRQTRKGEVWQLKN